MMNEYIKKFIEDNIKLIEKDKWEEIYKKDFPYGFTETLLESGINPLMQGLDYIPEYFLYRSKNIKEFDIPDNITTIGHVAFCDCTSLTSVTIPDSVNSIGVWAFADCKSLTEITYLGTKKEALSKLKVKNKRWRENSAIKKIICSDGIIEL